jgi:hypothetical protein
MAEACNVRAPVEGNTRCQDHWLGFHLPESCIENIVKVHMKRWARTDEMMLTSGNKRMVASEASIRGIDRHFGTLVL